MRSWLIYILYSLIYSMLLLSIANGQPKGKIEYYSTEQGLSHKAVTSILKDREGFMWFGSWDGINRFDGHSFTVYKSAPGDMSQLGNDRVDQMVEDQSGYLWMLGYDRQVYRFDKRVEQFMPLEPLFNKGRTQKITFARLLSAKNGLIWLLSDTEGLFCVPQNQIAKGVYYRYAAGLAPDYQLPVNSLNFFYEDQDRHIWIGSSEGLTCLSGSAAGNYKNSRLVPPDLAKGVNFTACDEDASHLYFITAGGELIIYDKTAGIFNRHKIADIRLNGILKSKKSSVVYATSSNGQLLLFNPIEEKFSSIKYQTGERLNAIYEDQNANLWIEPEKKGIIRFDPSTRTMRFFSQTSQDRFNSLGNRFKVVEDNNGVIWVNMKDGGFGFYDPVKGEINTILRTPEGGNNSLPSIVYGIYYDKAGILWLTTYERQLIKIILQGNDFRQKLLVENSSLKSENEIRGIYNDNKNRLWLGVKSGKLYVYQNDNEIKDLFDNPPAGGMGLVYSILQDRKGNIWLGTKNTGLYKAIPLNKEQTRYHLIHFATDRGKVNGLSCSEIYSLIEDRKGRIWLGSFDNGLYLINDEGDSTQFIHTGKLFANYPKEKFQKIRNMSLDRDGNIWIGTTNGLLVMDPNEEHSTSYKYVTYSKIPGDGKSLGNNDIQFVYHDSKDRMWLSTSGGGFCQAIGNNPFQTLQFRNYTTREGMPNDYVLSCAEDQQGNLWFATENGLARFNPETEVFRNYDSYDGLPVASFSESSAFRIPATGQLIFGTTKGIISFDPARINKNRITANLALTNLQINNKDAGPGESASVLTNDINYADNLVLKYNQNIISLDYALLDYRLGNRQPFAYRLMGFDSSWHGDRQQTRVTYTNLPPGDYVFEVKSLNSDSYSNTPYRKLAIKILPPPWKTWWAYLLYAAAIIIILFFVRRTALSIIRLRHKVAVEQKLAAIKLNFFTNVSHELRTPLTLILNPIEQLSKKENLSPNGIAWLETAKKNAHRMIRFINQLLDLRKLESNKARLFISRVEIISFVKKISEHFASAAKAKDIKLEIESDQSELIAWVDVEKLDVVIYNLMGNAIKFTPAGRSIRIKIEKEADDQTFSIAVVDQGAGVPKENLENIFQLFYEGDHAPRRELKGTGIGLALSRDLVKLHGGRIWAINNEEGGLTVTVEMKLGSYHYKQDEVTYVDMPKSLPVYDGGLEETLDTENASDDLQLPLVVLVEDNDELRSFIRSQLSEFYRVESAKDGKEGLEKALELIPDIIISDIMMPEMDGIQLLDRIKNDVNTSHIPVVLLSARYSIESQIEGLKYGADYYITKPFNNDFLIASVNNLLLQRKRLFESLIQKKKGVTLAPGEIVVTDKDELFLKDVIKAVEDKMADPEFNIETVTEAMNMARSTFYKKFKSLTSLSPVEFVKDMRLQRARQLLDAGGKNISEVAYNVGFSSPRYFSTCFKEKYNITPSEYLESKTT